MHLHLGSRLVLTIFVIASLALIVACGGGRGGGNRLGPDGCSPGYHCAPGNNCPTAGRHGSAGGNRGPNGRSTHHCPRNDGGARGRA